MGYNYTTVDGQRVETAVARALAAMAAEFKRVFGLDLLVTKGGGVRTNGEQWVLYNAWINYMQHGGPKANLAAKPPNSNHEEDGPIGPRAVDLHDSGGDAGVTVIGTARDKWLVANSGRWGFKPAGHSFSPKEAWHYEYSGALDQGQVAGGTSGITVDGIWGGETTAALQAVLGVTVDSQLGPQTWSALQRGLGVTVDGTPGPETITALQKRIGVTADGQLGPDTIRALQIWLNKGYGFTPSNGQLQVDGVWGPATVRKFQVSVGATEDGELGPNTWSKFQAAVGVTADGEAGPVTIKALQSNVGATVDGQLGPDTIRKLQEFLNAGKSWVKVEVPAAQPAAPAATPRTPRYPKAVAGWTVPLSWRFENGAWVPNTRPAGIVINRLIIHHETATVSQVPYFKTANARFSCPTWEVMTDGTVTEMIDPVLKPSSTGTANSYSVAIETTNTSGTPVWGISPESHEAIAQIAAWLSQQTELNGVPVDIKLDRVHIIGHKEAGVNATACPGPSMNLDQIVTRAQQIVGVTPPVIIPPVDPEEPEGYVVTKSAGDAIRTLVNQVFPA